MTRYVGLDVSQRMTAICIVDEAGHRLWRGQCRSVPSEIEKTVRQHAGEDARIGIETGSIVPSRIQCVLPDHDRSARIWD